MKLKALKTSIKIRALAFFLIVAAITLSMLWIMQGWFFSTRLKDLTRVEMVRTMERYSANFNYETDDFNELISNLNYVASANGMVIYCFAFKGDIEATAKTDEAGRVVKRFNGEFKMQAVVTPFSSGFFDDELDASVQSQIIYLTLADNSSQGNTHYVVDESTNKITYASFRPYADGYSFYFYMEAVVPQGGTESGIYRLFLIVVTFIVVALCFVLSILFSKHISSPINKLSLQAELITKGNYGARFPASTVKEIDNLAKNLNYVSDEFGKTEQFRRDFLANITHDFRTPLTLIRGYAELMLDYVAKDSVAENIKQKQSKNAQIIVEESMRLANLVDDIQKLSKIQAGTDTVNAKLFDINFFLSQLIGQFRVVHIKYGVPVEYVFEERIKVPVYADSDKIGLVMYNLITNAINYAAKEEPKVIVRLSLLVQKSQKRISKKQTQTVKNYFALVEVSDNGKGIAPEEIESVWDRYYRAGQKKRNTVGSGLGLSIVKSILSAHDAPFGVKSEPDKGTTFWFKLKVEL